MSPLPHNYRPTYDKGRCVPVGWKPLMVPPHVRRKVFAHIARRRIEAKDKEAQRRAAEDRQKERELMRERADEDLERCEQELERLKKRRDDLAAEKHECFTKLKAFLQRDSMNKKAEEERKRREILSLQMQQPLLAAAVQQTQTQAQTNSLISQQHLLTQQNLIAHHYSPHSLINQQSLLSQQNLITQQAIQQGLLQQGLIPQGIPQSLLPQMTRDVMQALNPKPGSSSNYSSSNSMLSPHRERSQSTASPSRYATPQSRHNSFAASSGSNQLNPIALNQMPLGIEIKQEIKPEMPSPQPSPAPRGFQSYNPSSYNDPTTAALAHALANIRPRQ